MKTSFSKTLALLLVCLLGLSALTAAADTVPAEADGSVINIMETPITSSFTGVIETLNVREGSYVQKGDTIATLKTTKVYATEDGTVRLFGRPGDSAETLTAHYGAVAYVEPAVTHTITASTSYAYNSPQTKTVHPGEKVYLRAESNLSHIGNGMVTAVSGTNFTVDVLEGSIQTDDIVYVYRDTSYAYLQRIGRGSASRVEYTAYEGSGVIAGYCVEDGSAVRKGDVLFETVEGDFAGYGTDLTQIKAPASGAIGSLSVSLGSSVTAGDSVCTFYPDEYMRVEAELDEESLAGMPAGSDVTVRFTYIDNGAYAVKGVVEQVSAVGNTDDSSNSEESLYKIIIKPENTAGISYGMAVTVNNS